MARISKKSKLKSPHVFVDLLTDYGFKLAFGDKETLLHFLNSLFEADGVKFTSVRYLNKELTSTHQSGRTIYYDVLCKVDNGTDVIIEMQHQSQDTFGDRALYYMSSSIVNQGDNEHNWHYNMRPVYGVFLLNFHLEGKNVPEEVVNEVNLTYKSAPANLFTEKFRMFFIDLLRFDKTEDQLDGNLDCWIYNIKNMGTMTARPKKASDKVFDRLYSRAEVAAMSPRQRREYEASLKLYRDSLAIDETNRRKRKQAKEEGRIEERIAIVRNLKALGVEIEKIMGATGLSAEEIAEIN